MPEGVVDLFAQRVFGDEELDAAPRRAHGAVLQRGKAGLAHHALEHHAASQRNAHCQRLQHLVVLVTMQAHQLGGALLRLEIIGEGHALLADRSQFLAPFGDELVLVNGGLGSGGVGHGRSRMNRQF